MELRTGTHFVLAFDFENSCNDEFGGVGVDALNGRFWFKPDGRGGVIVVKDEVELWRSNPKREAKEST